LSFPVDNNSSNNNNPVLMKLLDNERLVALGLRLSGRTAFSRSIARLELYSCKMAGNDKRFFKQISNQGHGSLNDEEPLAPSPALGATPPVSASVLAAMAALHGSAAGARVLTQAPDESPTPGPGSSALAHTCSRKTLYFLKATLNASFFPDYDFADAASHEFTREPSFDWVHRAIHTALLSSQAEVYAGVSAELWQEIADAIEPADIDIYSYTPDLDSDPFATDGALWSFNYFFYNKKLKRILFFTYRTFRYTLGGRRRGVGWTFCVFRFLKLVFFWNKHNNNVYQCLGAAARWRGRRHEF
jgi:hypothetical protein